MYLVGAAHGAILEILFSSAPLAVRPSSGLVSLLESLPPGSEVGLERPEKEVEDFKGDVTVCFERSKEYWQPLQEVCQKHGLKVVYLDSYKLYKKMMEKDVEKFRAHKGLKKLRKIPKHSQKSTLDHAKREKELLEGIYASEVEFDYIREILRDQSLLEKIAQNPQMKVAIVGQGHGDYWLQNPHLLSEKGINFESYWHDNYKPVASWEVSEAIEYRGPVFRQAVLCKTPFLDQRYTARHSGVQRKFNAVKTGRIFPDRKPNFVGTWDMQIPARGLFELYMLGQVDDHGEWRISGEIEDVDGQSTFDGTLKENEKVITFNKRCSHEALLAGGTSGVIFYQGFLNPNGSYSGFFDCLEHGVKADFTIKPLSRRHFLTETSKTFINNHSK